MTKLNGPLIELLETRALKEINQAIVWRSLDDYWIHEVVLRIVANLSYKEVMLLMLENITAEVTSVDLFKTQLREHLIGFIWHYDTVVEYFCKWY